MPKTGSIYESCVSFLDNEPAKNVIYLCKDEKHLCDTISANRGSSELCWEIEFDDDCYASIRIVCHEKGTHV